MMAGPEPEYVGMFCRIIWNGERGRFRCAGYRFPTHLPYERPSPELRAEMAAWRLSEREEAFARTGNATYAWDALRDLDEHAPIPLWLLKYLKRCSRNLGGLLRLCSERKPISGDPLDPPAAIKRIPAALGFVKETNFNAFYERKKDDEAMLYLVEVSEEGGDLDAQKRIARWNGDDEPKIVRRLKRARETGRTTYT